jgi:hypothetical protein
MFVMAHNDNQNVLMVLFIPFSRGTDSLYHSLFVFLYPRMLCSSGVARWLLRVM